MQTILHMAFVCVCVNLCCDMMMLGVQSDSITLVYAEYKFNENTLQKNKGKTVSGDKVHTHTSTHTHWVLDIYYFN